MARRTFSDKTMMACYTKARELASDNFSEFYYACGSDGPRWPHRGAAHRCYYWNGRTGKGIVPHKSWVGYAFYAAGVDDARSEKR